MTKRLFLCVLVFLFLSSQLISPAFCQETYHVVKPGETLAGIAKKYGVKVEDLKRWNNLRTAQVKAGQKLVIKKEVEVRSEDITKKEKKVGRERRKEIIYKVAPGENLTQIAKLFGVSEDEIIKANNLGNKSLKAGQRLIIPIPQEEDTSKREREKAKTQSIEDIFQELQRREEELKKGRYDRRNILELISEYRHFYLMYPGSPIAPLALFKTGELYLELYQRYLKKDDALEAGKRFELFLKNYSNHELAEKAYKRLLEIYERELKNEEKVKQIKAQWGNKFPEIKSFKAEKKIDKFKKEVIIKQEKKEEVPTQRERQTFIVADLKKVLKIEPITGEDYTRIIIDLSGNFEYRAQALSPQEDKPPRVYVDIFPATLSDTLQRAFDIQDKHLQRIRVGQFDRQTVRVVLDMHSLIQYRLFKVNDPPQLIIDLIGKEKKKREILTKKETTTSSEEGKNLKLSKVLKSRKEPEKSEKVGKSEKAKEEAVKSETSYINLARQFGLGIKRIMLDPGHGGEDPGALGPNGLKEKDVVLKLAKLLGEKLSEKLPNVEILYTRTSDVFIPLAKRPALANTMKADLFISIHLNASSDPNSRGIETYYLNFTTDPEAMRVAALENRVNDKGLADLQDLVKAILANTKLNESRLLAEKVQKELVRYLSSYYPDVVDRGVKYAPFLVLVGTRMPAILIEADFITNPISAERLMREEYIERLAEGIARGVVNYIQSLKFSEVPVFEKERSKTGS
ncbi:MAG: N-acetylmuramoyl-L-alanine amidase [Caldimicrobium sp.]